MKTENDELLPASARRAFEGYPQIQASPDFNARILARVFAPRAPSRLEIFCDRMDAIFARPILKLLSAAFLGGFLALAATGLLIGWSTPAASVPQSVSIPPRVAQDSLMDAHQRLALIRQMENPYATAPEYSAPRLRRFGAPAKREKSVGEINDQRSSQCPAAFRSLV